MLVRGVSYADISNVCVCLELHMPDAVDDIWMTYITVQKIS